MDKLNAKMCVEMLFTNQNIFLKSVLRTIATVVDEILFVTYRSAYIYHDLNLAIISKTLVSRDLYKPFPNLTLRLTIISCDNI